MLRKTAAVNNDKDNKETGVKLFFQPHTQTATYLGLLDGGSSMQGKYIRLRRASPASAVQVSSLWAASLIGVQLGAVAGQVEHLDLFLVLLQPRLHRLGMVHFQVVQHQEHFGTVFFPGLPHQTLHEVDQDAPIHGPLKALEANLAPVGDAGDDGQAFSALVDANLRCLAH